jgi:hypothetical protein
VRVKTRSGFPEKRTQPRIKKRASGVGVDVAVSAPFFN